MGVGGVGSGGGLGPVHGHEETDAHEAAASAAASMPAPDAVEAQHRAASGAKLNIFSKLWHKLDGELAEGEQKVLNAIEPKNTSGTTPNAPANVGVGALNILETGLARIGLMHPFKTYNKWVDAGVLMRGSEQSGGGWSDLQKQGIKTVVNLRYEDNGEAKDQAKVGIKNVWLPSYDQSLPTEQQVAQFLKVANDPKNQPVYVHCEQGVGRTGVMCAAFRMQHDGWTADQAIAEAKQMGMNSADQEKYIRQLYADLKSGKLKV
ncbi:MAG TPA: dual specificity protein phosphatase family protein [Planctomycetota bacterium]|nr:dual specificity protein phosphatase family protein [Planctomycetota bacterium]